MNVIVVDDEKYVRMDLCDTIKKVRPMSTVNDFTCASNAIEYIKTNKVDIAFLDIEMPETNGIEMAKLIVEIQPEINIIFTTGFSEYALDAMMVYASGYLLKPISVTELTDALMHLRYPIDNNKCEIKVSTFGNFEVFVKGKAIHFPRSRSKELLAYLVHKRGTGCTLKEGAAVLFEDKEYNHSLQSQMQTVVATMMKTLKENGAEGIVVKEYNNLMVNRSIFECDIYEFEKKYPGKKYEGEYMNSYSWSEWK